MLKALPFVVAPFALVAVATLWYNQARYGAWWAFPNYQQPQAALTPGLGERLGWALSNLWHYTLNPSQGLLIFNPPVLLGLWGLAAFVRRHADLARLLAFSLGPLALFYVVGWGLSSWSWGLRFAYVFIPWLILPCVCLFEAPQSRGRQLALGAVLLLGLGVQALGVLHNPVTLYERALSADPKLTVETMMTTPATSPIALAIAATPATLQGGRALLTAGAVGGDPAASRAQRGEVPDLWYFLQLLSPLPRWLTAAALMGLLGAFALAVRRLWLAVYDSPPDPTPPVPGGP